MLFGAFFMVLLKGFPFVPRLGKCH
uniref:Uncharacterized protein n=1 Tax=Anguilla anguilla TaxID=7936 RepID=A0A0E9W4W7_ANGAN